MKRGCEILPSNLVCTSTEILFVLLISYTNQLIQKFREERKTASYHFFLKEAYYYIGSHTYPLQLPN